MFAHSACLNTHETPPAKQATSHSMFKVQMCCSKQRARRLELFSIQMEKHGESPACSCSHKAEVQFDAFVNLVPKDCIWHGPAIHRVKGENPSAPVRGLRPGCLISRGEPALRASSGGLIFQLSVTGKSGAKGMKGDSA